MVDWLVGWLVLIWVEFEGVKRVDLNDAVGICYLMKSLKVVMAFTLSTKTNFFFISQFLGFNHQMLK